MDDTVAAPVDRVVDDGENAVDIDLEAAMGLKAGGTSSAASEGGSTALDDFLISRGIDPSAIDAAAAAAVDDAVWGDSSTVASASTPAAKAESAASASASDGKSGAGDIENRIEALERLVSSAEPQDNVSEHLSPAIASPAIMSTSFAIDRLRDESTFCGGRHDVAGCSGCPARGARVRLGKGKPKPKRGRLRASR